MNAGMNQKITPKRFHEADGIDDWRVIGDGACAVFRTGSLATGARFAQAISSCGGHPDVDLRSDTATVRLISRTADSFGLTERDLELARQISAVAGELGLAAEPGLIQNIEVCIDALAYPEVFAFWRAILGYEDRGDLPVDLIDPRGRGPLVFFQEMDRPRPQRNRIHLDVWVPHDQAEARVKAALEAGGTLVTDEYAPHFWVLADAEGNEACVCTWQERVD
jgi:4a-hydroxytetrahydrobiopterin dehydratase